MKIAPKKPIKGKINWSIVCLSFIAVLSWVVLILVSVNLLIYYVYSLFNKGFFDSETLKFALYLAIGTYFICILDKKKVREAFGMKDVNYIPPEEREISLRKN